MTRASVGECWYRAIAVAGGVVDHEFVWTADSAGAVRLTVPTIEGVVWKLVTRSSSASSSYAVTLLDEHGFDVLLGRGAGRDGSAVEGVFVYDVYNNQTSLYTTGLHVFNVSGAGSGASGVTVVTTVPLGAAALPAGR